MLDITEIGVNTLGGSLAGGMAAAGGPAAWPAAVLLLVITDLTEDVLSTASLGCTVVEDVYGGFTYVDTEEQTNRVAQLVIGRDTTVEYIWWATDALIPGAGDWLINVGRFGYEARRRYEAPTWEVRIHFGWPFIEIRTYDTYAGQEGS
jgi:hypothetical protein